MSIEVFRCDRLPGEPKLTRKACGLRWDTANGPAQSYAFDRQCVDCPIGAAHSAGERPDVPNASVIPAHGKDSDAGRPAQEDTSMGQTVTCKGCGKSFERERGPQQYCRTCRPAKPKGHAAGKRKRSKRSAGDTPLQVAESIVEQLSQLSEADQRRTLDLVHVALGHGTVHLEDDAA